MQLQVPASMEYNPNHEWWLKIYKFFEFSVLSIFLDVVWAQNWKLCSCSDIWVWYLLGIIRTHVPTRDQTQTIVIWCNSTEYISSSESTYGRKCDMTMPKVIGALLCKLLRIVLWGKNYTLVSLKTIMPIFIELTPLSILIRLLLSGVQKSGCQRVFEINV